jgi:hypothetical protein
LQACANGGWPPLLFRAGVFVSYLLVHGRRKAPSAFGAMQELIKIGILAMLSLIYDYYFGSNSD